METWAIFTGDIVKSTAMTRAELDAVFTRLEEAADAVATWQDQPTRMTRFRGDGWQMAVTPQFTFRAALVLRAAVRRCGKTADTRFGIGLGDAHFAGDDLSRADGAALVRSGHALDTMPRARRMNAPDTPVALRAALPRCRPDCSRLDDAPSRCRLLHARSRAPCTSHPRPAVRPHPAKRAGPCRRGGD